MIGAMETDKRMIARCHCGAVEIAIPADTDFSVARRCDCSYCRRRWVPTAGVDADNIEVIKGADMLTLYQFNTKKAEHFFCRHCGIYTHHRRRSDTSEFGVNITCFDHINMQDYNNVAILDGINHPKDRKLET
jgi:hypothetical protein